MRFLLFLTFTCLIIGVISFKQNSAFQLHDQNFDDTDYVPKNSKKARINEKQKFQLQDFYGSFKDTLSSIKKFALDFFDSFVLRKAKSVQKTSIIYRQNFASQNGGAQILMVSSSKIKSPKAILRSEPDAYLFTADVLPITIVIGLKEQILIDSFAIQSGEVYSCITEDFMLQGAFSLQNQEWILLGNFTAQNSFQTQQFAVEQTIIRYIRLTIHSSYGKWKYFTLSHIKVYGEGLFSHAMESLLQTEYKIPTNKSQGSNKKESSKKSQGNHHSNKDLHTKQILVEAFEQLAVEGKQDITTNKHKTASTKQTSENSFLTDPSKMNDSQPAQKTNSKDKKSVSILKKKITYLQKRNFQLNQQLKQLKKLTEQKFLQLESIHFDGRSHKNHHEPWYEFMLSSQSLVIISMIINIACLVLVGMVFKNKVLSRSMTQSQRIDGSQNKEEQNSKEKQMSDKKDKKKQKRN